MSMERSGANEELHSPVVQGQFLPPRRAMHVESTIQNWKLTCRSSLQPFAYIKD